jgi:hypothetical protein
MSVKNVDLWTMPLDEEAPVRVGFYASVIEGPVKVGDPVDARDYDEIETLVDNMDVRR